MQGRLSAAILCLWLGFWPVARGAETGQRPHRPTEQELQQVVRRLLATLAQKSGLWTVSGTRVARGFADYAPGHVEFTAEGYRTHAAVLLEIFADRRTAGG